MRDEVGDVLDYLQSAELAIATHQVCIDGSRVSWPSSRGDSPFLINRSYASLEQFNSWINASEYSAILFDGSLLQISYDVGEGDITGHRLAYIPCPFDLDPDYLSGGEALSDVIEMYADSNVHEMALRSPVRFDYDPGAAAPGHPSSHMTINSADCRIACVAPVHVLRFVDFVFANFYSALHAAHIDFFGRANDRHAGGRVLDDSDASGLHLMWPLHGTVL